MSELSVQWEQGGEGVWNGFASDCSVFTIELDKSVYSLYGPERAAGELVISGQARTLDGAKDLADALLRGGEGEGVREIKEITESDARRLLAALGAIEGQVALSRVVAKINCVHDWGHWADRPEDPELLRLFRGVSHRCEMGGRVEVIPDKPRPEGKAPRPRKPRPPDADDIPRRGADRSRAGIIDFVVASLRGAGEDAPLTRATLLAMLAKRFPDRDPQSMRSTLWTQLPGRLRRVAGLDVRGDRKTGYWIPKGTTEEDGHGGHAAGGEGAAEAQGDSEPRDVPGGAGGGQARPG